MVKTTIRFLKLLSIFMVSTSVLAATSIEGAKVIDVVPDKNYGVVYVVFDTAQTGGTTSCVLPEYETRYQINELGTPISDALLSAALTALASEREVRAVGMGICNGRENVETIRLISFLP